MQKSEETALEQGAEQVTQWTEKGLEFVVTYGPKIIGAILFILAAWILSEWVRRAIIRGTARAHVDLTLGKFFSNIAKWGLLLLAIIACLGIFGVQTASYAAVIGSAGLAIGLAMQGSLSNIAAGVMLMLFRPFKVGDAVTVAGQTGVVDEIELFSTRIDTADNRRVIIPNGQVFGAVIENSSHHPTRKLEVTATTDYDAGFDAAHTALTKAAESVSVRIREQPADIVPVRLGAAGVEWTVGIWVKKEDFVVAREALIRAVMNGLSASRIAVPASMSHLKGVKS